MRAPRSRPSEAILGRAMSTRSVHAPGRSVVSNPSVWRLHGGMLAPVACEPGPVVRVLEPPLGLAADSPYPRHAKPGPKDQVVGILHEPLHPSPDRMEPRRVTDRRRYHLE